MAPLDEHFMTLALRAALRGYGRTCPNPAVGAVVVKEGKAVSTGHHAYAGAPHAEVVALARAGEAARGATLYVTLEPCCHAGRTPPCTEAIVRAGVREVVYGVGDISPHCDGKGACALRDAGLGVRSGPCAAAAATLNAPFFKRVRSGLPFVSAKWAMTLDGKTATAQGDSRWISSAPARAWVHRWRSRVGAVLVGSGTALRDDPRLTARLAHRRQPLRVVADSSLRLPIASRLAATATEVPVLVAHAPDAPERARAALRDLGVRTLAVPAGPRGLVLEALLRALARGACGLDPVDHVLLEGGGEILASAVEEGLVDSVSAVVAPRILGGRLAKTAVQGDGARFVREAVSLHWRAARRLGEDWLLEATPGEKKKYASRED